jgi:hypothetical protein
MAIIVPFNNVGEVLQPAWAHPASDIYRLDAVRLLIHGPANESA